MQCGFGLAEFHALKLMPPAKHRAHYRKIAEHARELKEHIKDDLRFEADRGPYLSSLAQLEKNAIEIAGRPLFVERPSKANAARTFFIRYLDAYLRSKTSKTLITAITAATSAVVDEDMDERHVEKILCRIENSNN